MLEGSLEPSLYIGSFNFSFFELKYGVEFSDETTRKVEGPNLSGLFRDLTKIKEQISEFETKKGVVTNFLLGYTGSGKSTLTNIECKVPL